MLFSLGRLRDIIEKIRLPHRFRFVSGWLGAFNARKTRNVPRGLCVLPWMHLNIMPDGRVLHCCMNPDYSDCAGYLPAQTIEEIWNGNYMKSLRKNMISGKKPVMCARCYEQERCSGTSPRLNYNRSFRSKLKEIPALTRNDGSLDKVDLRYWNFRFSNRCNYKCRTCGIESSSGWLHDGKKLGWLSDDAPEKSNTNESEPRINFMDIVRKYIDQVEEIYFVGGEPLLMDEHWQILEMLNEQKKYQVHLHYNTNLSVLKYRNKNIEDYWAKWGRYVRVSPSIDDVDERAELIRCGTKWGKIEKHLRIINGLGVVIIPTITVSAMNVFRLPEVLNRLIEIGIIRKKNNWKNFEINVVENPAMFHVSILPDNVRHDIATRLERYMEDYKRKYKADIRSKFLFLGEHLKKPWDEANSLKFKNFTNTIDKIRSENTLDVIPELRCILND